MKDAALHDQTRITAGVFNVRIHETEKKKRILNTYHKINESNYPSATSAFRKIILPVMIMQTYSKNSRLEDPREHHADGYLFSMSKPISCLYVSHEKKRRKTYSKTCTCLLQIRMVSNSCNYSN